MYDDQPEPDATITATAPCRDCGRPFDIDAGERSWFLEREMSLPRRCRPCRAARRDGRERTGVDRP